MRTLVFIVVAVLSAAVARADRAGVESVLRAMGQAAAGADVDGYMSHVASADPIFFKEQQNWAKDLRRKPPASVAFTIGEPPKDADPAPALADPSPRARSREANRESPRAPIAAPDFGEKKARFEMVTSWTMPAPKEGAKPSERSVSFPVVFVLGENGKWLYAGEDWVTLESDESRARDDRFQGPDPDSKRGVKPTRQRGARVKFFAGYEQVAERIVEALPPVRDHVDEGFQNEVPRVQEVKVYPTMRHLQESIYLSYTDGLSGWNEPGEAIKLLVRPNSSKRGLTTLLAHEYGHVATFEFGPKSNDMPWWALEGVAELSAERFSSGGKDAEAIVLRWSKNNSLAKWDDLADFHKVQDSSPRDLQAKVYKQGHHMLMYISDRFGRDARNAWLRAMAQGKTIDQASRDALKMGWDELDAAWRESVKHLADKQAAQQERKDAEAGEKNKNGAAGGG
jgi:hypothetical protein